MTLNKLCDVADWRLPYLEGFPLHRKCWEYQHVMAGLQHLETLHRSARVLAVGAGHEAPVFTMTGMVDQVHAIDLYGDTSFPEADRAMLTDPDRFAPLPYDRKRLVVQHMSALDLRYPDGWFDAAVSFGAIEHFGGMRAAMIALSEMARVTRPKGIVAFTTECVTDGGPHHSMPGLELFSRDSLLHLTSSIRSLRWFAPPDLTVTEETRRTEMTLGDALATAANGEPPQLPHIVVSVGGRAFTSVAVFLVKEWA